LEGKTIKIFIAINILAVTVITGSLFGEKPNIIYFNADDLGIMDVGFNSSRYITPNIDKLREEGMLFTDGYAPSANCAPSRAACMSGQFAARTGVYTVGNSDRGPAHLRKIIPIKNSPYLPEDSVTMAEALKAGGYTTIHIGKWHLGEDPCTQGFDVNIGGDTSGMPIPGEYFSPFSRGAMKRFSDQYPKGTHRCDIFSDHASKFIKKNKDSPFFMYMAYYSVHTVLQPVPGMVEKYKGKKDVNATYASMIEKMDESIGKILAEVDAMGLKENTLVLFTSDNGGICKTSVQSPFRAGKGSYFEGGVREPLVVRWPAKVAANSTCKVPVTGLDFYPTLLEAAGVKKPAGKVLDGKSIMPLLTNRGEFPERPLYWHFPIYLPKFAGAEDDSHDIHFRTRPGTTMRLGKWKLHEYFEDGRLELYDLDADIGERKNLAESMPERAKELHAMMKKWRQDTGSPVPTKLNPKYNPDAKPVAKGKKKN
jgi:arylsulfatase A-like enzyme